jgi:signal transduction histidine kinase
LTRYAVILIVPVLLWALVVLALREPLRNWISGDEYYDRSALIEWLEESRGTRETLPEMLLAHEQVARQVLNLPPAPKDGFDPYLAQREEALARLAVRREEIREHLQTIGLPPTKMYTGQLPLFPTFYFLEVTFDDPALGPSIVWDSELPRHRTQYQQLDHEIVPGATVHVGYQLHAYNKRQHTEQEHKERFWLLSVLAVGSTVIGMGWMGFVHHREREREKQRQAARQQAADAERRREDTERKLLEQRLATQAAEQRALELKSQLYASIGIMAGSYAHNIKNLLVRPNDLLNRCLEDEGLNADQSHMLQEVRETLGTVTERLQQILRTVRRDPSRSEPTSLDLGALLLDVDRTWKELARDKWKLDVTVTVDESKGGLWVRGDPSHLQQAVENLLFNARDATFEMRKHLRDAARSAGKLDSRARQQALIDAAAWKGAVVLRAWREGSQVLLEVRDNGIGMTEEVRRRCVEPHFSTKRDNALYEGHNTGMGLGLSFVVTVLEHHGAELEIETAPHQGATFRAHFHAAEPENG